MKHPVQPLEVDEHGVTRFKANAIVRYLLDRGGIDMSMLAALPFDRNDREQFAQLIGCSRSEIDYVIDDTFSSEVAGATHCDHHIFRRRGFWEMLFSGQWMTRSVCIKCGAPEPFELIANC